MGVVDKAVAGVAGAVANLARWGDFWQRGMITGDMVKLWTAACVSPVDCGEKPRDPDAPVHAPPERKLRPIACAECALKLVEGAAIDAVASELVPVLEPAQLGCGTPDGAGIMVSLLRSWAEEESDEWADRDDDPTVFAGLDLENAYGRAYRSACVRGLRRRAPTLAPLAATQWSCDGVIAWQRSGGEWRPSVCRRGGWQGSRLMQISFCCGLEEALDAARMFSDHGAAC